MVGFLVLSEVHLQIALFAIWLAWFFFFLFLSFFLGLLKSPDLRRLAIIASAFLGIDISLGFVMFLEDARTESIVLGWENPDPSIFFIVMGTIPIILASLTPLVLVKQKR